MNSIRVFPFFISFFCWNEINKKSPIKEDTRKIKNCKAIEEDTRKMENCKADNIPENIPKALILSGRPWEKSIRSHALQNCSTVYLNSKTGMVFLPVNPPGPFEHDHEGKSKWVKYYRPELDGVLFYDMKYKYCRPEFDDVLFLWHETQIFRFGHEIFRCYGCLFFHIQRTWWRNFYFMLYIKQNFLHEVCCLWKNKYP